MQLDLFDELIGGQRPLVSRSKALQNTMLQPHKAEKIDELIVDNFAGGGGASTGMELALGRPVDIAINHDKDAIAMHRKNHPYTTHYCENVFNIDPRIACHGHEVALAWFSPDCKHFSKAKGGKPVSKKIRGLAWITLRWAGTVHPRVIILENVEEFVTWGPVSKGKPIKSKKGETFHKFVNQLEALGYTVEWRELRACDYGAPTIRKRLILIARCDGRPTVWPAPTHGSPESEAVKSGQLLPWKTAADCIDFTLPCKTIFNRKKPLAEKTMRRIARGTDKFVIKNSKPFIIPIGYGERQGQLPRVNSINEPVSTVVASGKQYIVQPAFGVISEPYIMYNNQNNVPSGMGEPVRTITTGNRCFFTAPSLIQYHSETVANEVRGKSVTEPMLTVDSKPRYAIIESHLCVLRNNMGCKPMGEPLPTITTSAGHFAEIRTYLHKIEPGADLVNWSLIREMLNSYCGYSLAEDEVLIIEIEGTKYFISDICLRMLEPKELYAAQGVPADYIIDFEVGGKKYSKAAQVARCGNMVCPPLATALVRANLPELCADKITTMAELRIDG